jgi:hypothetical protein
MRFNAYEAAVIQVLDDAHSTESGLYSPTQIMSEMADKFEDDPVLKGYDLLAILFTLQSEGLVESVWFVGHGEEFFTRHWRVVVPRQGPPPVPRFETLSPT